MATRTLRCHGQNKSSPSQACRNLSFRPQQEEPSLHGCIMSTWYRICPHLVQCGSRSLTSTEANYAIIELECLAITWAIKKCRIYLAGSNFNVYSDHKPLKQIFKTKSLDHMEGSRVHRLIQTVSSYTSTSHMYLGKNT